MKTRDVWVVFQNNCILDEFFATEEGAKAFVRICKGVDRKDKVKNEYSIFVGTLNLAK